MADGGSRSDNPVAWSPLAGSQALALVSPCNHTLYEGTRGPGKTDWQIMKFRKNVGLGYGKFWRGILFDREYKNLEDIVSKMQRWYPEFADGAKFAQGTGSFKWKWPTGEEFMLRHIKRAAHYWIYHGQEFPSINWNELTKYPTSELYDMMMSCNRSSFLPQEHPVRMRHFEAMLRGLQRFEPEDLADQRHEALNTDDEWGLYILGEIPLEVNSTTNPFGPGHNWVKREYIDKAEPGEIVYKRVNVFNPRTQEREVITKTQVRIFGSYKENTYLSPEYIAELESMKDENKREAWLYGNWNIVAGGALDDVWAENKVVVDRFQVPDNWVVDRSMDWGSTAPYWVGWWAEANGEEVTLPGGKLFAPAPGSLILIGEIYGAEEIGTNQGSKQSSEDLAQLILDYEEELRDDGWIDSDVQDGPADNQIFNENEGDQEETFASKMEEVGVTWERSNKSRGSRKRGLQMLRDRLQNTRDGKEKPGIYFMRNCWVTRATLPVLPRNEDDMDDVDTDSEDHAYDGIRYRVLKGNLRYATKLKTKFPT
jgi:hypothetical protein